MNRIMAFALRSCWAVLVLLAVACTKAGDDNACPARDGGSSTGQELLHKPAGGPVDADTGNPAGGCRNPLLNNGSTGQEGGSISDDGDDEADKEGPNKRGRNN